MNKTIVAVIIVAAIALGAYVLITRPSGSNTIPNSTTKPTSQTQPTPIPEPTPLQNTVIAYTDQGYTPNTLRVKMGTTVVFKNQSSLSMWTAAAAHPSHTGYPTTGGCAGSTFDSCKGIQPGNSWSFKFDIVGTWKYHNHVAPGDMGTVVVE